MTVPEQTGESAKWQEGIERRLEALEAQAKLGIFEVVERMYEHFNRVELARQDRWHKTRDAVLPAIAAVADDHGMNAVDCLHDAAMFADAAHGPLGLVVDGPVNVSAESLAKGGKLFTFRQVRSDQLDALVNAADRILRIWVEFNSQEMYGEMLRDGMTETNDFSDWDEAHDALREAHKPFETL